MARFYGLPMRSSGVCAASVPDGQDMWETSNSLWVALQLGTNMVYHSPGWLEGGLIASPEKFVMDCEIIQMIQRYMEPQITATTLADIAFNAIKEVGPTGHFLASNTLRIAMRRLFMIRLSAIGAILRRENSLAVNGPHSAPIAF
jgi:trimethylamine--corrinoid protein Co-methyltransferase